MDPIAIASTAASVLGNIYGGIKTAELQKQQQAELDKEKRFNEALFNKEYYQDVLKRSENQSFLRELNRNQKENQKRAERSAAITGATPEAEAAQAKADSDIYAQAVNRMAGLASQRKDMALANYANKRLGFMGMQNDMLEKRKASWGTFMNNASNLASGVLSSVAKSPIMASEESSLTKDKKE